MSDRTISYVAAFTEAIQLEMEADPDVFIAGEDVGAHGGVFHTLPYLMTNFKTATTIAIAVVLVELWVIAWIRARYMDTRFLKAAFEVVVGGLIVFAAGIAIGSFGGSH